MRPHVKMLSGNYLTFEIKSEQSGGSPDCRLCSQLGETPLTESLEHLISLCVKFSDVRTRIKTKMMSVCQEFGISIDIFKYSSSEFCQFLLDPSSLNLNQRVGITHPALPLLFKQSRDFCFSIDQTRSRKLKSLTNP